MAKAIGITPHRWWGPRALPWSCCALLLALTGCGGPKGVSGTVTYDGKDVEKGFITFFPADGVGNTAGAKIVQGRYTIADLAPGRKKALVTAEPTPVVIAADGGGQRVALQAPEVPIPADAPGNNTIVEVTGGGQVLDLKVEKPR